MPKASLHCRSTRTYAQQASDSTQPTECARSPFRRLQANPLKSRGLINCGRHRRPGVLDGGPLTLNKLGFAPAPKWLAPGPS
ncbi:hypothetical protein BDV23DRAFT_143492 [Aspergillus alliaceus]|uniref:Uncharacterized protein n=1 Tax=Petromyces alliaceus TaxID=209559 RepID=A0A5N6FUI7_PETAA|nr:uncharacterized protein BDW43DRAFT_275613 [Aspergillus alliaceus]KAB8233608.1 hypothetical protein BDW43DRAFT_275613 [Aspergillus alliaceus]KAE8396727.1 hypothetical protein BDV23DRAFT_143492 [Aspergillus alliaceus]